MPAYFASDVHLRLDRPERGRRFARWVAGLEPRDSLTIVGDLCDFWFASRHRVADPGSCAGLQALVAFQERGGSLAILPGNHDAWLGPLYESILGVRFLAEPVKVEVYGLRLLLIHGHRLEGRRFWKTWMEGRTFHRGFRLLPSPVAGSLDRLLERSNQRSRRADDELQLAAYRRFAMAHAASVDLVVAGHVHRPMDESTTSPRLIVLGGWHASSSFLKVDDSGASLVVSPSSAALPC